MLAGGLPSRDLIRGLKGNGGKVVCFAPSLGVARKLVRGGADALVIEGMEAGGHIGPVSTSVLAQEILPHVREVPVFAAGGIGHGDMVAAYLNMGAGGVQMGTVFACATELIAHPAFKRAFIRASARDAVPSVQVDPEFRVTPVRALANPGTRRFVETQIELIGRYRRGELTFEEASLAIEHYWAGALRRAVIDGDVEQGSLMAGQSVGLVTAVRPVREILAEIVGQAEAALARLEFGPAGRRSGRLTMPTGGWGAPEPPEKRPELTGSRRLLKRLIDIVAEPIPPQQRLDRLVSVIAANLVAEVCSVYVYRAGEVLELFATEGLAKEAVHRTRLRVGEGLVGTIAAQGTVINAGDAQAHPAFAYRPETGEEIYHSFLGVPILRAGRVVGVLTVQNRTRRTYGEDEVEAMQVIASVLAEMLAGGELVDRAKYGDVASVGREMRRVDGLRLVEGVAVGHAWHHEPRVEVTRILADDPQAEIRRLDKAVGELRRSLDEMLARPELVAGEQREVLEAYRMFAHDTGWLRRIREAIETGLAAEAAVRRVQEETRVRIGHASDPYLRETLLDLEDLADRLLRHLVGRATAHDPVALPQDVILVARNLSAADLLEYDRSRLRGVALEEGSKTAHVTIVARAFDIPMLGRIDGVMDVVGPGDLVALDGDNGQLFVRPGDEVQQAFQTALTARYERRRKYEALRDVPPVTRDGIKVTLAINAAFLMDLAELDATGADGCGLYRTELSFMTRASFPGTEAQAEYYGKVLDHLGERPVIFRTLDVGSDKHLPYWRLPPEDNPAMGWRALRMMLDRPAILRRQLRAMLMAARRPLLEHHVPDGGRGRRVPGGAPAARPRARAGAAARARAPPAGSRSGSCSRCRRCSGSSRRCCRGSTSCPSAATTSCSSCSPATAATPRSPTATTCSRRRR